MKLIQKYNDFLNEKLKSNPELLENVNEARVKYKRKYTDKHPAKTMNTNTKIRSKIISAMSDGVLTEDELNGILKELEASPRWFKRNSSLFELTDEGYSLSKKGKRMSKHITPKNDVSETPVNKKVGISISTLQENFIKSYDNFINESKLKNSKDAVKYIDDNFKKITGKNHDSEEISDDSAGKIERYLKQNKIDVDDFWEEWLETDHVIERNLNEGAMSDIDVMSQESKTFKEFKKNVLKEYTQLKDDKDTAEWLEGIYNLSKELN